MLPSILLVIFVIVFCIQMGYWLFLYGSFAFANDNQNTLKELPVSVIVAAKNEAENLDKNLPLLLEQQHTNFELIIINDASTDSSAQVISRLQKKYPHLVHIELAPSATYQGLKKNALTKGIEQAKYPHLLFTDADCIPLSRLWIQRMTSSLQTETALVFGYGAYKKLPGFLNKLIRYETLLTAIQYFSYTLRGLPYMGVGRNLAYKKEVFDRANGFENHRHILSGDDDLFINQVATKTNSNICFSEDSFTESVPKTSFSAWFRQKRRHISTAPSYRPIHQFLLGSFFVSQLLFWILAIGFLTFSLNWQLVLLLILIRQIVQLMVLSKSADKLNERDLILWSPLLEVVLIGTQLILFIYHIMQKPTDW